MPPFGVPRVSLNFVGFPPSSNSHNSQKAEAPSRRVIAELPDVSKARGYTISDLLQQVKRDHLCDDDGIDPYKCTFYTSDFAAIAGNTSVGVLRDGEPVIVAYYGGGGKGGKEGKNGKDGGSRRDEKQHDYEREYDEGHRQKETGAKASKYDERHSEAGRDKRSGGQSHKEHHAKDWAESEEFLDSSHAAKGSKHGEGGGSGNRERSESSRGDRDRERTEKDRGDRGRGDHERHERTGSSSAGGHGHHPNSLGSDEYLAQPASASPKKERGASLSRHSGRDHVDDRHHRERDRERDREHDRDHRDDDRRERGREREASGHADRSPGKRDSSVHRGGGSAVDSRRDRDDRDDHYRSPSKDVAPWERSSASIERRRPAVTTQIDGRPEHAAGERLGEVWGIARFEAYYRQRQRSLKVLAPPRPLMQPALIVSQSMDASMGTLHGLFHSFREYVSPVLKDSKFRESGFLTPEEFVLAGDFLVYKCPTWSWAAGVESKRRDFLPADKQYLITRNVPCLKRVAAMEYRGAAEDDVVDAAGGDDEGWVATHRDRDASSSATGQASASAAASTAAHGENDAIRDIDDEDSAAAGADALQNFDPLAAD
ncbi:Arabinose-proton symporter (Arabinose transporter), partial [Cladochytrium tenue]